MAVETRLEDLAPVGVFCRRYPEVITEGGLRWAIFNEEHNGLAESGAIIRRGRRILIDIPKFRNWLVSGRVHEAQSSTRQAAQRARKWRRA